MENKPSGIKTAIIVILALVILGYMFFGTTKTASKNNNVVAQVVTGNAGDLVNFSVNPGANVSGNMTLTGTIKNAYFFEANIVVKVTDANQNVLLATNGTAITDWMTAGPVTFTSNVNFTGLPSGPGFIVIENDNPSGDPALVKQILIPVIIN